eukprot:scaffold55038_cov66-Phaeocystis_antarctica.AAC.4
MCISRLCASGVWPVSGLRCLRLYVHYGFPDAELTLALTACRARTRSTSSPLGPLGSRPQGRGCARTWPGGKSADAPAQGDIIVTLGSGWV